MYRNIKHKKEIHTTKTESHENVLSDDKPDSKMGIKKAVIDGNTGEMVLPSSTQKGFLKRLTSKKRRQHEHYNPDVIDPEKI